MENLNIAIKNELIDWIRNLDDSEALKKLLIYKNQTTTLLTETDSPSTEWLTGACDQQFAAGMTSEELLENICAHLKTLPVEDK